MKCKQRPGKHAAHNFAARWRWLSRVFPRWSQQKECALASLHYNHEVGTASVMTPFSIYPNSLGALSDPTVLLINRSPFGAGSINRKFGLRSLMESLFVVVGNFRKLCLGFGLFRFGNLIYQETQISILGESFCPRTFCRCF